jgi:type IX secretion system PorP/SprF family membrane protein
VLLCKEAVAQQDAHFAQYMFNSLYLNPAAAGLDGSAKFSLLHRTQWAGYGQGTPETQVMSFSSPIMQMRSGGGVHIVRDVIGARTNIEAQFSYAYHLPLGPQGKLSIGGRLGAFSQTIGFDKYRAVDPEDVVLTTKTGSESQFKPDAAFGVWYKAEKYFGGISVNHLIKSEFDFGIENLRNPLSRHMYVTGGYNYEANYSLIITPSALIKTDFNTYSFDLNVMATYNNKYWGGLSYRQQDALSAVIGFAMLKDNNLRLGYALDLTVPSSDAKKPTSHELLLSYSIPVVLVGPKPVMRVPRYRKSN